MRIWTADEIARMVAAMERRKGGFRVSAETAPLVIAALSFYARQAWSCTNEVRFVVEELAGTGATHEILATTGHIDIANGAYAAAIAGRPGRCIVLRDPQRCTLKRSL